MRMQRTLIVISLAALFVPQMLVAQETMLLPKTSTPKTRTCDPLTCQLPTELQNTERFLRDRKNGLPYTPEPRPLVPQYEVTRLNQLSQTLGYLNLYRAYRPSTLYRDEALGRVEYFLSLGSATNGNGPRDGMTAYMYFDAYSLFGDQRFLNAGLAIANSCLTYPEKDMVMNGGLMCALGLAAAYRATGSTTYRDASRRVTAATAPKQFPDGAFPHLPTLAGGKNLGYTAWMGVELLLLSRLDPTDQYTDFLALKSADFLSHRVNADGTLSFATATEDFDSDPGNTNAGYGHDVSGLFSVALNLAATGRPELASKVLRVGLGQRLSGTNFGGYPDIYGYTSEEPITNIWVMGYPSVLRTSLIFWYMSMFKQFSTSCPSGPQVACVTSSSNCSPVLAAIGVCTLPVTGTQTCLAGRYTQCLNVGLTSMQSGQACGQTETCSDGGNGACYETCTLYGSKVCYQGLCADQCSDINIEGQPAPTCMVDCIPGQFCLENQLSLQPPPTVNICELATPESSSLMSLVE